MAIVQAPPFRCRRSVKNLPRLGDAQGPYLRFHELRARRPLNGVSHHVIASYRVVERHSDDPTQVVNDHGRLAAARHGPIHRINVLRGEPVEPVLSDEWKRVQPNVGLVAGKRRRPDSYRDDVFQPMHQPLFDPGWPTYAAMAGGRSAPRQAANIDLWT
jgi:hypothetical protein